MTDSRSDADQIRDLLYAYCWHMDRGEFDALGALFAHASMGDGATADAPGLAGAEIREIRVGLRPLSSDGLPVLGAVPGVRGAFLVTGHGPSGLTLGAYSGKLVAEQMLGKPPALDMSAFSVSRFDRDAT